MKTLLVACAALAVVGCRLPPETDDGGDARGGDGGDAGETEDARDAGLANDGRDAVGSDARGVDIVGSADAGLVCTANVVVNTAPTVAQIAIPGDPPAPAGGPLMDGRYHLTEAVVYTGLTGLFGPTGATLTNTIDLSFAATGTALIHEVAAGPTEVRQTYTVQATGTTLDVRPGCPRTAAAEVFLFSYSASGGTLAIQKDATVNTYTRQ